MKTSFVLCVASALALAGCGGGPTSAFQMSYPDNRAEDLARVSARVAAAGPDDARPVAVGLTGSELFAWDLSEGRRLWSETVREARTAPSIAGDLVVLHEGSRVVARRLADGTRAFDVADDHLSFVGASGDGGLAAIVLSTTGGGVGSQSRLIIARNGGIDSNTEVDSSLGVPAVRAGLVFVPWGSQTVSVIDPDSGGEVARLISHAGVVGHAVAAAGGIYFGQSGVGRFGAGATGDGPSVGWRDVASGELPGAPPLWRSAYDPPSAPDSAIHKIRLAWAPSAGDGAVRFADDSVYLTFYRFVFALSPSDLSVRWVRELDSDVVGAAAREGGVLIAQASGQLRFLGTDGRPTWSADMGAAPTVVALRLGAYRPSGAATDPVETLGDQLLAAAQSTDARLVPARTFAIRALAREADPEVTGRLIVLCDDVTLPGPLRAQSCQSLALRENGADAVLSALSQHASFLASTTPPPVGPLAAVAARIGERRAVPLLVSHLSDPNTPVEALAAIAAALGALGDASAAAPLKEFLWLYHAEAGDDASAQALAAVAQAVLVLEGPDARQALMEIIEAPFTTSTVTGLLSQVLAEADRAAEAAAAEAAAAEEGAAEEGAAEEGAAEGDDDAPGAADPG